MATSRVIKAICCLCTAGCGILLTFKDNKITEIHGDPESMPNQGNLCAKGQSLLEYLYHPERLKQPLKRAGERGEGKWQKISWDEAFSLTAEELNKVKYEHGPEAVVMVHGSAKGFQDTHLVRLANAFGTPNVVCSDHVCHVPNMLASELTFGFLPTAEYEYPPKCVVIWGNNPAETMWAVDRAILRAINKGTKLIVIDPLETEFAKRAELWLKVRPGSDLALALGMINVIINEELYDKNFVDNWTVGFEKLKAHVQDYPPQEVTNITWVPADLIVKATRLYATSKPAYIQHGNALVHNVNSFQCGRALAILMALTGNLGVPGGEIETSGSGFRYVDTEQPQGMMLRRWSYQLELRDAILKEKRQNKVGAELNMLTDFRYTTPSAVVNSVLEGDPYQIHAAYIQASNPLSCWSNIKKVYQALKKIDFLAVSDLFMTPTAALSDIVFPVASFLEYDGILAPPHGGTAKFHRKIIQIGECRSDHEIVNGLAEKLGLGKYFWNKIDDFWDAIVQPVGLTFTEFKKIGRFAGTGKKYKQYEQNGFRTPSGKVELYSSQLEDGGFDPLPVYHESPETPYSDPELVNNYPLLCTTRKLASYRHSEGRQIPSLRGMHPDPVTIINSETANDLGIKDGDWIYIENKRGRIRQKAKLSASIARRVIVADHAWWFPEKSEKELFGWAESNYNVLTNDKPPFSQEVGSFNIRGIACKVYKAT